MVSELGSNVNCKNVSTATAVKFLFARKFDVQRAVALYEQHELIRQRECLYNLDPMSDPLRTELETGKFTILVKPCGKRTIENRITIFFKNFFFSLDEMSAVRL